MGSNFLRVTSNVVAACCTIPMAAACGVSGPGRATAPGLVTPIGTVAAASTDDTVVIGCEAPRESPAAPWPSNASRDASSVPRRINVSRNSVDGGVGVWAFDAKDPFDDVVVSTCGTAEGERTDTIEEA